MIPDVELLGFSDLVSLFGVSKTRVEQIIKADDFPETHYVGAKRTRVWDRGEVLGWATTKERKIHLGEDSNGADD